MFPIPRGSCSHPNMQARVNKICSMDSLSCSTPSGTRDGTSITGSSTATVLLGLAVFLVYAVLFKSKNPHLPPSPLALPVIGHLHLIGKTPHRSFLKLAQKYGGFVFLRFGSVNTLVVSSPDAAKEVLKTHDIVFASRAANSVAKHFGYNSLGLSFAPYGDHWRHMRKVSTLELLTAKRVEMFQHVRKFELSVLLGELLKASKERSAVILSAELTNLTFNIMMRMVMNKSTSTQREEALFFKNRLVAAFDVANDTHIGDFIPWLKWMDKEVTQIEVLQREMDEFLQKEVDQHRKEWNHDRPKDFMDVMVSLSSDAGLGDTLIKAMALDLVAAGFDSTAITVEWALSELIKNPELMKKAQAELDEVIGQDRTVEESDIPKLDYLQAIVKETLRLHAPGPLLYHESTAECRVRDYIIPAKTRVMVNVYAIGRDPSNWNEPLRFDPQRFLGGTTIDVRGQNFELLPFGSGRRSCPGMLLGITTAQFMLGNLLHAFDWRMPDGYGPDDLDMAEDFGATLPRATPLKLVPSARLSAEAYHKMNPKTV